ncbi:MAG: ISL3 family transposase [Phycisphaerae bacterium]|nr:ISL3 family transposase [Phycisphaerae bacterium]
MYVHGIRALFPFPGYVVQKVTMTADIAQVVLRRDRRFRLACPACGATMAENRAHTQTARDLALGTVRLVIVTYPAIQGRCSACGSWATIHPPGIDPHAKATRRLMHFVCRLARYMPLNHIPEIVGISERTAGRWDRKVLREHLPEPDLDDLRILLIDEKAVRKHHGYVTLVMNGLTGELLHLAEGKKKASLRSFFDKLSDEQRQRVVAVGMDRAGAYREVVKAELPDADIVFDKFHLIANYHAVIDEVRRSEWRKANAEDKAVIKGQRYNLFRNPWNRTGKQRRDLMALLHINENLAKAYILKGALRKLWDYKYRKSAAKYLAKWCRWAAVSGVEALRAFGRSLLRAKVEVLNYCKHRITTGRLEGFNNTVSRIVHRACGMRDLDYLFLKLRQESLDFVLQS